MDVNEASLSFAFGEPSEAPGFLLLGSSSSCQGREDFASSGFVQAARTEKMARGLKQLCKLVLRPKSLWWWNSPGNLACVKVLALSCVLMEDLWRAQLAKLGLCVSASQSGAL